MMTRRPAVDQKPHMSESVGETNDEYIVERGSADASTRVTTF